MCPRPAPPRSDQDTTAQERLQSSLVSGRKGGGPAGKLRIGFPLHTCREHGGVPGAGGGPMFAWLVLLFTHVLRLGFGQGGRPV